MRWGTGLAAVLLAGLAACGQGDAQRPGDPVEEPGAAPAPTASASDDPLPCVPGAEPFTGEAADALGAEAVMTAYCRLAELTLEHGFTSLVVPDQPRTVRDYAFVRPHLSPPARRRWDAAVQEYVASGDPRASGTIDGLTLHEVAVPSGYLVPPEGPYSYGTEVGPARATLTGDGSLALALEVRSAIVLEEKGDDSGRHSLLPVTRQLTYELVPGGVADEWLVDRWRATTRTGEVRIVTGG